MAQMKEEIKTPGKELNKMEMNNLSNGEFKTAVTRMHKELSEDLNSIKQTQTEMKDILMEIKNNLQGINSRTDEADNQSNDMEHKKTKNNQAEQHEEKRTLKNEDSLRSLGDNFKQTNVCIIEVPKGEEKDKKLEIHLKK